MDVSEPGTYDCNFYNLVQLGPAAYFVYKPVTINPQFGITNLTEIDALSRLSHPNIIHADAILTPYTSQQSGVNIVLPVTYRTLHTLLSDHSLTTGDKLPYLHQIACALSYLHQQDILHLDVKALNISIVANGTDNNAVLCNMASCAHSPFITDKVRVTLDHRAPELLGMGPYTYTKAVDVWSYGIMFIYMITGLPIYPVDFSTITIEEFHQVVTSMFNDNTVMEKLLYGIDSMWQKQCIDLCQRMLAVDSTKRCSFDDIIRHELFTGLPVPTGNIIKSPYITEYSEYHRDIIKLMVNFCITIFEAEHVQGLLIVLDLYKRCSPYYKTKDAAASFILGITCIYLASKYCNYRSYSIEEFIKLVETDGFKVNVENIISTEIAILHMTNGIIGQSLFDICRSAGCITYLVDNVLVSRDNTLYSTITSDSLAEYDNGVSKHLTISKVYE